MLQYIKNLFKRDQDPNQTRLRKLFKGSYKGLNDTEQAVLMLRLSGMSQNGVQRALEMSPEQLHRVELKLMEKLAK